MKILLLYPFGTHKRVRTEEDAAQTPIGLYYLGAVLKEKGYDVEILNWHYHSSDPDEIAAELERLNPDVIGLSVFQANRHGAIRIASIAKKVLPTVKLVFGGVAASTVGDFFLTHVPEVDVVVTAEAEISFPLLVEEFTHTQPNLQNVPGILFRDGGQIIHTPPPPPVSLEGLPDPALYYTFNYVISSRGCPGNCIFCGSPDMWGRKVRSHSATWFVNHLERLYQNGIRFFHVSDDTFTLKKDRVIAICKEIIQRSLPIEWSAISRIDCVDVEVLTWMRKAGCIQISYGIESADPAIRKWLGKQLTDTDIQTAIEMTLSVGILPRAYIIYGTHGETPETAQITLEKLKKWKPLAAIFYMLEIFPGTQLYRDVQKKTDITDDIWLNEIESIAWAEIDPTLSVSSVFETGQQLRNGYVQLLPEIVQTLSFVKDDLLAPYQADFLSRLAITFSHGEYTHLPNARAIADDLLNKALSLSPDARAFWGKGLLSYEKRELEKAVSFFEEGLQFFPEDALLHIYLGYAFLVQGKPKDAWLHFQNYATHPDAQSGIQQCKALLSY